MNTHEQILQMVKDGTITVEEGAKLLNAVDPQPTEVKPLRKSGERMIRVLVDSEDGDRVRVNLPMSLVKLGLDLNNQFNVNGKAIDLGGIDLNKLLATIDEDLNGEIATIDSANGDKVRIIVD
jgi:hypothetical protein